MRRTLMLGAVLALLCTSASAEMPALDGREAVPDVTKLSVASCEFDAAIAALDVAYERIAASAPPVPAIGALDVYALEPAEMASYRRRTADHVRSDSPADLAYDLEPSAEDERSPGGDT